MLSLRFAFAALLAALVAAAPAARADVARLVHPKDVPSVAAGGARIVGGSEARVDQWPYQVYIQFGDEQDSWACGGTVIAPRWVLTAAHCVADDATGRAISAAKVLVLLGSKRLSKHTGRVLGVRRVVMHSGYPIGEANATRDDMALLELEQPTTALPVRLPRGGLAEQVEAPGHAVTALGWGRISGETKETADWLLQVELPIIDLESCRAPWADALRRLITEKQICAGEPDTGRSTCNGDSGGPILARAADGHFYQVGVVSWGAPGCASTSTIFSRVSAFLPWIEQYVKVPKHGDEAVPKPANRSGDRALLVGLDDYQGEANDLNGSVTDARNMQRLLTEHLGFRPEQVKLLTNNEATRDGILGAFDEWLIGGSTAGSRLFFFFAGHGYHVPDGDGDEEDGQDEVLLPHDFAVTEGGALTKVILDDELRERLARIPDRKVTVVVDSCHSGTMTRSIGPVVVPASVRMPTTGTFRRAMSIGRRSLATAQRAPAFEPIENHVTAWTAVSPSQLALVDLEAPQPQGVFTRRFVDGIASRKADFNHDGKVSHAELLDYVTEESEAYCRRQAQCTLGLTPTLEGPARLMTTDVITGESAANSDDADDSGLNGRNEAKLEIAVEPDAMRPLDDRIRFRVSSTVTGHFTLFEIGPDNAINVLLPNPEAYIGEYLIERHGPEVVPDSAELGYEWFGVGPPLGSYTLVAVVSEARLDPDELLQSLEAEGPEAFIASLAKQLRERWADGSGNVRSPRWSIAKATYEIVN